VGGRLAGGLVILIAAAGAGWLGWYGYQSSHATTGGLNVIGLLRDVQTCVGLSYEAYQRRLAAGEDFGEIPKMKATPFAAQLVWDPVTMRATATFAGTHRDYDGKTVWIEARLYPDASLHWTCGTTVESAAMSYENLAEFIERCERPLEVDSRMVDYCTRFVPLPARKPQ
jgi:hypothetical protein